MQIFAADLRFYAMNLNYLLFAFFISGWMCSGNVAENNRPMLAAEVASELNGDSILLLRFAPPKGFVRNLSPENSFGYFLQHLPLKPAESQVLYYDGRVKNKRNVYAAVVNLPIGTKDLHQCADAVMRLRADFLWQTKQFGKIHFNFTNGFRADYVRWRNGDRIRVTGNNVQWIHSADTSRTYATYWNYLETVFSYAGTLSLSKELQSVEAKDMKIGDVFIQGGSPGHAVIVVDMAADSAGNKVFMLAQSYMPAQEIHVLLNPSDGGVWYTLKPSGILETPEWDFNWSDFKRFAEGN